MRSRELQCLFTMQWIYVMYSTKKIYVMFSLKCMSSGQKNTTGIIVPFNFVPFNFVLNFETFASQRKVIANSRLVRV